MAGHFRIGDISVASGEIGRGAITSFRLAGHQEVRVPGMVLNGKRDGPTLLVTAGVHGREVSGIGALHDALKRMDVARMSGRVIAIPVANPLSVAVGSYITPHDNVNLAEAVFPTNPRGSVTQRIAAAIEQAIHAADYAIDMHANAQPSIPFVLTTRSLAPNGQVLARLKTFAEAFGVTVIDKSTKSPAGIAEYATHQGKPGMIMELAGNRFIWDSITAAGARGILNCAKSVGILPGDPEPQTGVTSILKGDFVTHGLLRVNVGGFLRLHKGPGEFIRKEEHVASILDCYGDVAETVVMPVDGYCWAFPCGYVSQTWAVTEGDSIAYVFKKVGA